MDEPKPTTDREYLISIHGVVNDIKKDCLDHEARIRCLENERNKLVGALVTVSVLMGVIGSRIEQLLWG